MTSSFFTGKIVRQDTIDLGTEKSKLHPGGQLRESHDSIQYFLLASLRDQLLKVLHDLVPSSHHGLDFILGEITLSSCRQFVSIQRLQFVEQLPVAAH